jgi:hypothetical protein
VENKLCHTDDYGLFVVSPFNRDVTKMGSLLQSMKRHGYISAYPVHCKMRSDGKLEIKAGHHRFECAKTLGLSVYYVVSNDDATIPELERATTPWKLQDYVKSYARAGDQHSKLIAMIAAETGISVAAIVSIVGGELAASKNKINSLKEGRFRATPDGIERIEKVSRVVVACKSAKIAFASKRQFVNALSKLFFLKEFDDSVIVNKAQSNPQLFSNCATEEGFLEMLEYVHNYGRSAKHPLVFLAKEAAKERNRCRPPVIAK